jgi:hypothetical protein
MLDPDAEGSPDMVPGLIAGGVGALIAVLLSLPLHSPDDIFFNSLTVALAGAVLALVAAVLWSAVQRSQNAVRTFELAIGAAFVLVVVAAFAIETQLAGAFAYIAPLAAVDFGASAILTPLLASRPVPAWAGPVAVVLPLVLGAALVGQRDTANAALALPGSTASTAPVASSSPTTAANTATSSPTAATTNAAPGTKTPADVKGVTYIVSQGSTSQFVVREKLAQLPLPNDATVKNSALTGNVYLDGRPTVVNLDMSKFSSDQGMRDRFINQQWGRNPTATVTINDLGSLPASYRTGETVKQKVSGTIKIQGNEVPISFDVEAKMDDAGVLNVLGTTSFKWSDLKMNPPSTPSVSVQDTVNAQVLLIAKPTRG